MTPLGSLVFPRVKKSRPALTSLNIHGVFIIRKHTFIPLLALTEFPQLIISCMK